MKIGRTIISDKHISENLKPEALMRWCHEQSVDKMWTDAQAKIEVNKRKEMKNDNYSFNSVDATDMGMERK